MAWRRFKGARLVLLAVLPLIGACAKVLGLDTFEYVEGGAGDAISEARGVDAGSRDATMQEDATDAIVADVVMVPGNLLQNPSFEEGSLGCGTGWTTMGMVSLSTVAHSGSHSCMICGQHELVSLTQTVSVNVKAGQSISAGGYVLGMDGDAAAVQAEFVITLYNPDGGQEPWYPANNAFPSWTLITADEVAAVGAACACTTASLSFTVSAAGEAGCFLVDDVFLEVQ